MKNRFMICIASLFVAAALAQAGLWDPPILNHSFEWVENGQTGLSGWGYIIDDWFEYPDSDASVFWEDGVSIELPECDGVLWVGFQTGGTVYQAVGTVDDGAIFLLTALIGDRPADVFGTGALSLYASGSEDDGADDVELASFATLLDSAQVTMSDGTIIAPNINEVEIVLETGTGHAGEVLWLQVEDIQGKDYFDNIRLKQLVCAYNADPPNNAINIALDKTLSWNTAPDPNDLSQPNPLVTKHFVYMSNGSPADPNMVLVETVPAGSPPALRAEYDPPGELLRDGVYWWRIDEGIVADPNPDDANDLIVGVTWTFAAATSQPMLDPDLPADEVVDAGEDCAFTVSAINPYTMDPNGMTYAWYKVGDPVTVLSTTTTLDIPNAQITPDEGRYYCRVTVIEQDKFKDSKVAELAIKRPIGWWKLDGNGDDSSDLLNHGEVIGGGSQQTWWEDGMDEEAINVGGSTEGIPYVEVPVADSGAYNLTKRISVSVWVKSVGTIDGHGVLVGKQLDVNNRPWMLRQHVTDPWLTWKTHDDFWGPNNVICFDDTWHHIVATWDIDTGEKKLYMDGELKASKSGMTTEGLSDDVSPVRIGYYYAEYYFAGLLDDARIYNYAITPREVAELYIGFVPDAVVCLENPEFDLTDDCKVNIDDLAVFLLDWMKCNLYPTCIN